MGLAQTLELYAGGPGSGCNPEAAERAGTRCGRGASRHSRDGEGARKTAELRRELSELDQRLSGRLRREVRERLQVVREGVQREISRFERGRPSGIVPDLIKETDPGPRRDESPTSARKVVVRQFVSPSEGFDYTEYAAVGRRPKRGAANPERRAHGQKGQFRTVHDRVKRADGSGVGDVLEVGRLGGKVGEGTKLFVHRNFATGITTVQEFRTGEYSRVGGMSEYRFRNVGRAMGFLKKRYGVRLKLPKSRA